MLVQILRPISGLAAKVGDVVDASGWAPNRVRSLMKQRRCAPVMAPADAGAAKGRRHEATHAR